MVFCTSSTATLLTSSILVRGLISIFFNVGKARVMSSIPRSSSMLGDVRTHPWEYTLRIPPRRSRSSSSSSEFYFVLTTKLGTHVDGRGILQLRRSVFEG